jgi:hypothetical protein
MNAETKRFVQMLRDSNEPRDTALAMVRALLQHVEDMREDDPGDHEEHVEETLTVLEDALDDAEHALGHLL